MVLDNSQVTDDLTPGTRAGTNVDELFAALLHVHTALERHGIWHCLMFGTLLGAMRDGDLIPWDHDLDLLVRPVDVERILSLNAELAAEGLSFWSGYTMAHRLALNPGRVPWFDAGYLGIMRETGSVGELYAPVLFSDGVLRLYDLEREVAFWPQSSFPIFVVDELTTAHVRGVPFPVPAYAEQLLEWHYGPDWRTPYRSARDGGMPRDGSTSNGDAASPRLAEAIAWCEAHGWDRSVYLAQPAWPRPLAGAGPTDHSSRAASTSQSAWWQTLNEVAEHY
jgi:hypothetical protein